MANIDIQHKHSLPPAKARKAVEQAAIKLGEKFGLDYRWEGETLHFMRSGVDGRIALAPRQVHITAQLGFLLSALQAPIETEIRKVLKDRFV